MTGRAGLVQPGHLQNLAVSDQTDAKRRSGAVPHMRWMLGPLVSVVVIGLAACATVHQTYAPDGRAAYTLNCSGLARGWDKCLSAAGDLCKGVGYDILDRSDEDSAVASASGNSAFAAKTNERSMLVACKSR